MWPNDAEQTLVRAHIGFVWLWDWLMLTEQGTPSSRSASEPPPNLVLLSAFLSCQVTMSTLTEDGISAVKQIACDRLLSSRVEVKLKVGAGLQLGFTQGYSGPEEGGVFVYYLIIISMSFIYHSVRVLGAWRWAAAVIPHVRRREPTPLHLSHIPWPLCSCSRHQGKRVADVVNRIHVAVPKARDGLDRPPVIPPGVAEARARRDAGEKLRITEKDLQVRPSFSVGCCMSSVQYLLASLLRSEGRGSSAMGSSTTQTACLPACLPVHLLLLQEQHGGAGAYNADLRKTYDLKVGGVEGWRRQASPGRRVGEAGRPRGACLTCRDCSAPHPTAHLLPHPLLHPCRTLPGSTTSCPRSSTARM